MKKLNYAQQSLVLSIKTYLEDGEWDSYPGHKPQPHPLETAGEAYLDDKDFILEAVKADAYSLKYASDKLKNNKTIVKAAIKKANIDLPVNDGFTYSSPKLKKDKDLIKWCIKNKYSINIWEIDKSLWKDKSLIYNCIKAFRYCVFSSGVYWYKNELEQDRKLLKLLPSYFKDRAFIKKLVKIKDTSGNLAYKKAYRLLYSKSPKKDKWPRK